MSADGDPFMEINPEMEENVPDDIDDENHMEDTGLFWEPGKGEAEMEPDWCVRVKYFNGIEQEIPCYDGELADKSEELYFCLLEYFEPEEDFELDG